MKILLPIILVFFTSNCYTQNLTSNDQDAIHKLQKTLQWNDSVSLGEMVVYPLHRAAPIPNVDNAEEFIERYSELFDDSLKKRIEESDVEKDWSRMGYRGIMLGSGLLWIDDDGMLIALNYQSAKELQNSKSILEKDIIGIHESLRDFKKHVLILETSKFKIGR